MQHTGPIAGVASHAEWLASAGYDNQLILWRGATREALAAVRHDHLVNQCEFSHDGRWLVSASSDRSARVWSVPEMRLHAVLRDHDDDVDMAAFAPDDRRIATCALDRCVRVFDRDGVRLHEMHGHTGNVLSLAWSADGRRIVSSSVDGTLRTWDADEGREVSCAALGVRTDSVEVGAGGTVYAGDDRGRIAVIDAAGMRFVQAHRAGVKKVVLDERRGMLVSLSYDRTMALWRTPADAGGAPLTALGRCTLPDDAWARSAAVLDDGRVAVGTFGHTYALFDPDNGQWDLDGVAAGPALNALLVHDGTVYTVGDAGVVAADGRDIASMGSLCNFLVACAGRLFTGGQLGRLFDATTGQVLYEHHSPLNCAVAFERSGVAHLAVGTYTGEILIFAATGAAPWQPLQSLAVYANAVKGLSVGDGVLFSVCASTEIAWHRVADGAEVRRVPAAHERIANACCALGRGRFASVGRDRQLRLWSAHGAESFPSPHPNSVKCMAVDERGGRVLTGSYGGTLALFDVGERRWTALRRPTQSGISSIAWNPARQCFLAASYDGAIYPLAA